MPLVDFLCAYKSAEDSVLGALPSTIIWHVARTWQWSGDANARFRSARHWAHSLLYGKPNKITQGGEV